MVSSLEFPQADLIDVSERQERDQRGLVVHLELVHVAMRSLGQGAMGQDDALRLASRP